MPPRDPRECPALKEALPADDAGNGTWREVGEPREVLFGHPAGNDWREVTIVATWRNRHGERVVQVEWHDGATTWGGAYLADPELIREA